MEFIKGIYEKFKGLEKNTQIGIAEMKKFVDTLVIVPNEKLMNVVPKGTKLADAFNFVDDTLRQAIQGITDLITNAGLINLDFADVETIMKKKGLAYMGIGRGRGENRTIDAVRSAVASPLLETTLEGATGIILNVCGNLENLGLEEVNEAANLIKDIVSLDATIVVGISNNDNTNDEITVTVIATGIESKP